MKDDSITRFPRYQRRQKEMSLYFRAQTRAAMKSMSRIMADIRVDTGEKRPVERITWWSRLSRDGWGNNRRLI
jgi:hypothetical protein